ncbi:MAG: hypothetical protein P1Q69_16330 [Candidatus Thorarchaeota archaeon]|nr:hypothetical protein [Candidatus Thorarchaeota archaeon]
MKNLIGGIIGTVTVSALMPIFHIPPLYGYPEPFSDIWVILNGPQSVVFALQNLQFPHYLFGLLVSFIAAGIIVSLFSESVGKSIRTSLWMGVVLGTVLIASVLVVDPSFWTMENRNITLVIFYIQNILVSLISLVSAIPLVWLRIRLKDGGAISAPPVIQTTCDCGAVYKSKPMICSECGRTLEYLSTLSTDTAT